MACLFVSEHKNFPIANEMAILDFLFVAGFCADNECRWLPCDVEPAWKTSLIRKQALEMAKHNY
jgi:hypothetical protein